MDIIKRLAMRNREADPVGAKKSLDRLIVQKIRVRYSQDEENAILRKTLAGMATEEFDEYNAYVEQCKAEARAELGY